MGHVHRRAVVCGRARPPPGCWYRAHTITTGVPVVLGLGLALPRYGSAAVRKVLRGERPSDLPQADAVEIA